ncbi:ABC transporter permease [Saccharopolyspora phatthalungensis]|uniref:Peptide/nickel transport system permease protein n=1 Tax=Saccharopolyspora phatthalungensis TaxID=664693 RepID=A0A840QH33_9PSEU|nr:ABC transporter permease [Saccharopolyspora phatthalungensis]MBB5159816.1 peptide/nickel transport system permease protein [Saccharopolyspora phatthalungensis]
MLAYLTRKLCEAVLLLTVVSVLVFGLLRLAPGSIESTLLAGKPATPETIAAIHAQYHLDDPIWAQYWQWVTHAVRLDFGNSLVDGTPISTIVTDRIPVSAGLAILALSITLVVGVPLGLLAGRRQGTAADSSLSAGAIVLLSAPVYALATLLLYVFGIQLGWFPVFGAGDGFVDQLWHLVLPAMTLSAVQIAVVFRQARAAAIDVERADYLTFARARGLGRMRIELGYRLRNALLPVITVSALLLASSLAGVVFVEQIFSLPGLGSLLVTSIETKDLTVVQALALFSALLVFGFNLIVDVLYAVIDPRIVVGERS